MHQVLGAELRAAGLLLGRRIGAPQGGKDRRRSVIMTTATRRTCAALASTLVLGMWTVYAQQSPGRWDTEKCKTFETQRDGAATKTQTQDL